MKLKDTVITLSLLCTVTIVNADAILEDELLGIEETFSAIEVYGDVQMRADTVRDLPRPVESSFERAMARARVGVIWEANEFIEMGAALKVNWSTQSNSETRFNLDNEMADDVPIDELFIRLNINEETSLLVGQTEFPLSLSSMVWDNDLRPQGVSAQYRKQIGDFSAVELIGGAFLGNHLFGDSSRINAAQAAVRFGEGKKNSYDAAISYLDFNNLNDLARNNLRRTNSGTATRFAEDFEIVDVQLGVNIRWQRFPIRARLDLLKNVAASDKAYGGRVDLTLGNSIRQQGIEVGFAIQRIQQDAVVAAFNDDDWWFATNMRGFTNWVAYGFNESLRGRFALFHERLDSRPDNNNRALIDLQYFF